MARTLYGKTPRTNIASGKKYPRRQITSPVVWPSQRPIKRMFHQYGMRVGPDVTRALAKLVAVYVRQVMETAMVYASHAKRTRVNRFDVMEAVQKVHIKKPDRRIINSD
ncbi:MAG: hypothetical protein WC763_07380 [Candidatus Paceibacterota bacterium]